jgi:hypothetical protein
VSYDAETVVMLRAVLDDTLASAEFTRQTQCSAVDVAQYILHVAGKGERDPQRMKVQIQKLLSVGVA